MKNKRLFSLLLALILVLPMGAFAATEDYGNAKNIILLIPDGMNVEALTTSRWMTDNYSFTLDSMATGLVRTNNANTPIADSAPAGTAMATGVKTESPFVGTYPTSATMPGSEKFEAEKAKMPIANVLEAAKTTGRSTGIIATSNIQHATPADFSAHHPNRNNYEALGEQQVYQNMDVVLGAGSKYLSKNNRADGEDLISEIKSLGYDYVTDTNSMKSSNSNKLWGMFAEESLNYDIDRDPSKEPSLAEMTQKALDTLSKNDKGFFLMVEGSQIDWAAHANDPVGIYSDVLAFDKAVKVAKDFADKNGDTVIIAASDHGTGGMTFGNNNIASGYDKAPLEEFTKIIKNAKLTGQGVASKFNADKSNIASVMNEVYGIKDLSNEEINLIKNAENIQNTVGQVISNRSNIGWTTGGHVGGDVALYCYSTTDNAKILSGTVHNSDIGKYIADLLDVNLNELTDTLYIKARPALEKLGANVEFSNKSKANPVLTIKKDNNTIELPMYKNYALKGNEKIELNGLVIYNDENVYIPSDVLELIK